MRKTYWLIGCATLALAACSGTKKSAVNDDLKKDLELASSSDGLATPANGQGTQIVSAIERTAPAPKAPAPSSKARKHHRAPDAPPAAVVAETPSTVTQPDPTPVETQPVPVDPTPVSPRPQPQVGTLPSEGTSTGTISRGPSAGEVIGAVLGAVLRGAVVGGMGGDSCDPRTDGRHRGGGGMIYRRW